MKFFSNHSILKWICLIDNCVDSVMRERSWYLKRYEQWICIFTVPLLALMYGAFFLGVGVVCGVIV